MWPVKKQIKRSSDIIADILMQKCPRHCSCVIIPTLSSYTADCFCHWLLCITFLKGKFYQRQLREIKYDHGKKTSTGKILLL